MMFAIWVLLVGYFILFKIWMENVYLLEGFTCFCFAGSMISTAKKEKKRERERKPLVAKQMLSQKKLGMP